MADAPPLTPSRADSTRARIVALQQRIRAERLQPGPIASLRRGDPATVLRQPAFHRLTATFEDQELAGDGAERWATVIQGIALTGSPSSDAKSAGATLASLGFAESRFARLLASRGAPFRSQVSMAARLARSKGEPLDWRDLGELVLTEGRAERQADVLRLRLARAYYRTIDSQPNTQT